MMSDSTYLEHPITAVFKFLLLIIKFRIHETAPIPTLVSSLLIGLGHEATSLSQWQLP